VTLEAAVERANARAGRDAPFWPGATRHRLNACDEEQRRHGDAARFDRVRSAVTQEVEEFVLASVMIHAV